MKQYSARGFHIGRIGRYRHGYAMTTKGAPSVGEWANPDTAQEDTLVSVARVAGIVGAVLARAGGSDASGPSHAPSGALGGPVVCAGSKRAGAMFEGASGAHGDATASA